MKATFKKDDKLGLLPFDGSGLQVFDKIPSGSFVKISYNDGRSTGQNALFHRWCREIAKHFVDGGKSHFSTGTEINETSMKKNLKTTYLGFEINEYVDLKTGEVTTKEELKHTSGLDKGDMTAFLMLVDAFCVEYGIYISKPEDSEYIQILKEIGNMV